MVKTCILIWRPSKAYGGSFVSVRLLINPRQPNPGGGRVLVRGTELMRRAGQGQEAHQDQTRFIHYSTTLHIPKSKATVFLTTNPSFINTLSSSCPNTIAPLLICFSPFV